MKSPQREKIGDPSTEPQSILNSLEARKRNISEGYWEAADCVLEAQIMNNKRLIFV